jgi:hypothetical protein
MFHVSDQDLLALALPTHARLTLCTDMHPFAFFNKVFAAYPQIVHLALLNFVGVPPRRRLGAPDDCSSFPCVRRSRPGLAATLAPGQPVQRVTPLVTSTLYDGLRVAVLFDALGSQLTELVLVLVPDVDTQTLGHWERSMWD